MDIGSKLKNARTDAALTQEQAAQALGVSRQTMSNWENGKTYPDIVSVVKMSDLYQISLDRLLKEESSMSDYLHYLKESTNMVKSKNRLAVCALIAAYLVLWAVMLIGFWMVADGSDAMAFSILFLWLLHPAAVFILSFLIGKHHAWGDLRFFSAPAFGVMYSLAEYATFSGANMLAFHKINLPDLGLFIAGTVISLFALLLGAAVDALHRRKAPAEQ